MSIHLNARQDVSYLFSGLQGNAVPGKSTTESGMSWLSDYASIKNGSYGKLMKAYYRDTLEDTLASRVQEPGREYSKEAAREKDALSQVEKSADALKASSDALWKKGKDSIFGKEDQAVYDAVSSFVKSYNDTLSKAAQTTNETVGNRVRYLTNQTSFQSKGLAAVGITIGEDKSLKIDMDAMQKVGKDKLWELFQGNGSFGYQTAAQASLISSAAKQGVSATGLYDASGSQGYSNGNLFNQFF